MRTPRRKTVVCPYKDNTAEHVLWWELNHAQSDLALYTATKERVESLTAALAKLTGKKPR